jgi:hypothetical protein
MPRKLFRRELVLAVTFEPFLRLALGQARTAHSFRALTIPRRWSADSIPRAQTSAFIARLSDSFHFCGVDLDQKPQSIMVICSSP